jgi:hypothetical protein
MEDARMGIVNVGVAGLHRRADSKLTWTVVREDGSEEIASIVFEYHSPLTRYDGVVGMAALEGAEESELLQGLEGQAREGLHGTRTCEEGEQCHVVLW